MDVFVGKQPSADGRQGMNTARLIKLNSTGTKLATKQGDAFRHNCEMPHFIVATDNLLEIFFCFVFETQSCDVVRTDLVVRIQVLCRPCPLTMGRICIPTAQRSPC